MTSYGKKLRIAYIGALACIAVLSVASHLYLGSIERSLSNDAPITSAAGRQLTDSQRIANLSQQIPAALARGESESAATLARELRATVEAWRQSHATLVEHRRNSALGDEASAETVRSLALLDEHFEAVTSAAQRIVIAMTDPAELDELTGADASASDAVPTEAVSTIVLNTDRYLPLMRSVFEHYSTESARRLDRLRIVESASSVLTLFLLVLLALTVFEPAIRKLGRQESELLALRDVIDKHTIVSISDRQGRILEVNDGFCEVSGYSRDELIGRSHSMVNSGHHPPGFWAQMWETISSGESWRSEVCNRAKDGSLYWVDSTHIPQFDSSGQIERFISLRIDITEKKQAEAAQFAARAELEARRLEQRATQERLDLAMTASNCGLWDWNLAHGEAYFNEVVYQMLGISSDETPLTAKSWRDYCHHDDRASMVDALERHIAGETEKYACEYRVLRADGSYVWIRDVGQVVERDAAGVVTRIVGVHLDIQALRDALDRAEQAHAEQVHSQQRFELAIEGSRDAIFDWNLDTDQVWFSPRWLQLLNVREGALGSSIPSLLWHVVPEDVERVKVELNAFVESEHEKFDSEFQLVDGNNDAVWVMMRAVSFRDDNGNVTRVAGSVADITSLKEAQEAMERLVQQDHLTGLASRARLTERLEHAVQRGKRTGNFCGLLFFDFDRFKVVNDSLGHDVGDELLCSIAGRLRTHVREVDTPARFGGDEFVILLEDLAEASSARLVADKLLAVCAKPHQIRGHSLVSTASIGLVTSEHSDSSASELLRYADSAMYEAKRRGRACVVEFDQKMFDEQLLMAELEEELKSAIALQQLELHYQPVVDLQTGAIVSAEALLRWNHPDRGYIPPADFIPIAEESRQIVEVGEWVIEQACRQLTDWRERGVVSADFAVSVNASKVQLLTPGFERMLVEHVDSCGLPRKSLKLEVTETTIVDNRSDIGDVLRSLRDQSIVIMMDDFGTGHSSLSVLHNLPVDELKIDQSFIRYADKNHDLVAITSSIVTLAEHLSLRTIGEGIESQDHVALLQTLGCTYGQGYFWSRPVPPDDIEALLDVADSPGATGSAYTI